MGGILAKADLPPRRLPRALAGQTTLDSSMSKWVRQLEPLAT